MDEKRNHDEFRAEVRELRREIMEMQRCIKQFQDTYGPFLHAELSRSIYWAKVRQEVLAGTAKSAIWATFIVVISLFVSGVKESIKHWFQ